MIPKSRLSPTVQMATGSAFTAHQWVCNTTSAAVKGRTSSKTSFDCQLRFDCEMSLGTLHRKRPLLGMDNAGFRELALRKRASQTYLSAIQNEGLGIFWVGTIFVHSGFAI